MAARPARPATLAAARRRPPPAAPPQVPASLWARITGFIPTEIIGGYVAVLAILGASCNGCDQTRPEFAVLITFLVLCAASVWFPFAGKVKQKTGKFPALRTIVSFPVIATLFAFIIWAFNLPGSVLISAMHLSSAFTAIAGIVASIAIGYVAPVFMRTPAST